MFVYVVILIIIVTAGCTIPCVDGVFILDVSISIKSEANFQTMKDFVSNSFKLVDISPSCSRAAVILFGRDAWVRFTLNDYLDEESIQNALNQIRYDDISDYNHTGTNTPAALNLMRTAAQDGTLGIRNDKAHIAVFMTDGRPNIKHLGISNQMAIDETETAANKLHRSEIYDEIYVIGIEGNKPIGKILEVIATSPSLVFTVQGFDSTLFEELTKNIITKICNRKSHNYSQKVLKCNACVTVYA